MLVLGVDASLPILSVALIDGPSLVGAVAMEGKGSRNEKLLPAIDWLLSENAIDRRSIELVAVTRGPGSFTGVRIGLATAQGLAMALGRPVCAMSTHEAVAFGTRGRVAVADDAGRGEHYLSTFADGEPDQEPRLASAADVEDAARGAAVILIADFLQHDNVALRCARRAAAIEESGAGLRYRDVTPIYVRLAEADVKLRQKTDG